MWIKLVVLMAERGIKSNDLAKLTGLHRITISHLKNGKRQPSMETLGKLASALGVEARELL